MVTLKNLEHPTGTGTRFLSDLQLVLDATGVGMWTYDTATSTFTLDRACRRLFDLDDDEELSVDTLRRKLHPDDVETYQSAVRKSLDAGGMTVNYRVIRRDGSVRFISGRGHVMPTMLGEPPVVKGVCIDMTDRITLENQLRRTQERMQHLADGVPGLFSYLDRDYHVQFMSSQYRSIFGRSMDAILNKHISELIGEEAFLERKSRYDRALAGEFVAHAGERDMPGVGMRYFTINHHPHRDEAGNVIGVMTLAIDITDRRMMEESLQRKSEELQRSNHDLEQFAYVASHDLKAPLRAIEVLVEWLQEDLADFDGGEVQENLALLTRRTGRLNRLLDDLLTFSRAGRQVGDVMHVDTRRMVEDIWTLLAPPEQMRLEVDPGMPTLITYHTPLEQVIRNLINNAIKHHPTGEGCIRVYAEDQGESVMFAVEDDGAGIPDAYAEKVFKMFQTLQPRDEREGSGMGLAIVKRIVDWQDGHVWFHGGPGGTGAVFKFTWNRLAEEFTEEEKGKEDDWIEAREHIAG